MLVLRPIEELVELFYSTNCNLATINVLHEWRRKPQSSVLIMNREGADIIWSSYLKYLNELITYDQLIYLKTIEEIGSIKYSWNCLEYLDETSSLIHYTDVDTQPWLRDGNPNAGIWYVYLYRYLQLPINKSLFLKAIEMNYVRPSLVEILDKGPSLVTFSNDSKFNDYFFVPPHRFRKISLPWLRKILAPILNLLIKLQFIISNGQINIR